MSFIDPEAAIISRLQTRLAAAENKARVLSAQDLSSVQDWSHIAPSISVLFDGYAPTQEVGQGVIQEIEQDWTLLIVVRNARGQRTGEGIRSEASPLIDIALGAMCGWSPGAGFKGFRMSAGPGPEYDDSGVGRFELRFKTRVTVRGTN